MAHFENFIKIRFTVMHLYGPGIVIMVLVSVAYGRSLDVRAQLSSGTRCLALLCKVKPVLSGHSNSTPFFSLPIMA